MTAISTMEMIPSTANPATILRMVNNMVAIVPASAVVRAHPFSPNNQRTVDDKMSCEDKCYKRSPRDERW